MIYKLRYLVLIILLAPSLALPQAVEVSTVPTSIKAAGGGGEIAACPQTAADSVCKGDSTIVFEGATADDFETTLTVTDPTADRTITLPNATTTVAGLSVVQTFTANQLLASNLTFGLGGNVAQNGGIGLATTTSPDGAFAYTGTNSNSWRLSEFGDVSFDMGNGPGGAAAATTAPSFIIFSQNQNTTNYSASAYYGSAGKFVKTLTAATPTAVISIPVAQGAGVGGVLRYTVFASDGTDQQSRHGSFNYAAVNKAGTETCTLGASDETTDGSVYAEGAAGNPTLTYAITCAAGTDAVTISFNAASSLTETTLELYGRVDHVGAGEPLPQ